LEGSTLIIFKYVIENTWILWISYFWEFQSWSSSTMSLKTFHFPFFYFKIPLFWKIQSWSSSSVSLKTFYFSFLYFKIYELWKFQAWSSSSVSLQTLCWNEYFKISEFWKTESWSSPTMSLKTFYFLFFYLKDSIMIIFKCVIENIVFLFQWFWTLCWNEYFIISEFWKTQSWSSSTMSLKTFLSILNSSPFASLASLLSSALLLPLSVFLPFWIFYFWEFQSWSSSTMSLKTFHFPFFYFKIPLFWKIQSWSSSSVSLKTFYFLFFYFKIYELWKFQAWLSSSVSLQTLCWNEYFKISEFWKTESWSSPTMSLKTFYFPFFLFERFNHDHLQVCHWKHCIFFSDFEHFVEVNILKSPNFGRLKHDHLWLCHWKHFFLF